MGRRIQLKRDSQNSPLQSMTPVQGTSVAITIGAASVRVVIPSGAEVVRLGSTGNCYVKFGDVSITATSADMVFPTGAEVVSLDPAWTHVAAIQVGASTGVLSITEMQ